MILFSEVWSKNSIILTTYHLSLLHFLFNISVQFHQVPTYKALHEFISKDQLTVEFDGTLSYSHQDWVKFRMVSLYRYLFKAWMHLDIFVVSHGVYLSSWDDFNIPVMEVFMFQGVAPMWVLIEEVSSCPLLIILYDVYPNIAGFIQRRCFLFVWSGLEIGEEAWQGSGRAEHNVAFLWVL